MTDRHNTPFKQDLIQKLNEKNLSPTSIKLYVRNIEKLNEDNPLKNLNFLKDVPAIMEKLSSKKDNTIRAYLISISVCLSVMKGENKVLNKLFDEYHKMMIDKANNIRNSNTHEVSEEKKADFIEWNQVQQKYEELLDKVLKFKAKELNESQYNTLLSLMVLALYCDQPPRRNKDYQLCNIISKCGKTRVEDLPNDKNYICLDTKKFVFNVFKTARKEGQVVLDISPALFKVLELYLAHHPLFPKTRKERKNINIPFLVDYKGTPLTKINDITRILNKIFGKKIGSSMLRSIYLTDKYGDIKQEQNEDAKMMSHTTETQNETYIKKVDKKNKKE